ncbi:MAG: helix-turn-helix domain-containing protein [Thermomicrobiales bacterium]
MTWHDVEQSLGEWGAEHELMAVFGDTLRQARAYKGVTLREAERTTRINRYHLAALEEENFSSLPPLIYQRGIVRNYATYLDLDANKLLSMFDEARGGNEQPDVNVVVKPLDMPSHWAPNFAIIAFMVVMSAIVFAWLYSAYFAPTQAVSTPAEVIATVTPVDAEALFIPSPTPPPPTSTPAPTATASPTEEPTATPTEEATEPTEEETFAPISDDEAASTTTESSPPESQEGLASIMITAESAIYVEISIDGVPQFAGELAAGQTTEWYSASVFEVFTTDGSQTLFTNGDGVTFYMGYGANEYYTLDAGFE